MAKDLRLDVVTSSDPKGLLSTAAEMDKVADKAEKLGHKFDETAVEGAFLAKELEAVRLKNEELARSFDQSGDRAILKQLSANQRYESQLKRVGAALDNVGKDAAKEGEALGKDLGDATGNGFFNSIKSLGDGLAGKSWTEMLATPQGLAAAGGAGYLLGGAVLAGIGLAGVGSGIVIALHDPQVKASLDDLKKEVGGTLKDAAKPFVAPLDEALNRLGADVETKIGPGLSKTFKALAPEVLALEHGVEGFLNPVISGFENAAIAAKPLLDDLGNNDLPALGQSIKGLFDSIATAGPTARNSLDALVTTINSLVTGTSFAITSLGKLDNLLNHNPLGLTLGSDSGVVKYIADLNKQGDRSFIVFNKSAGAVHTWSGAVDTAKASAQALKAQWDAVDKALGKDQAENQALDTLHNSFKTFTDSIKQNGTSLDQNTVKGRANREMFEQQIQTLASLRDQMVANGVHASVADKLFQGWVATLDKAAEKAGFTKQQIEELNKELKLLTKPHNIVITVNGKTGYLDPTTGGISVGGHKAYAAGGRYKAGEARLVGENGPELDIPDHSGTIIPNSALRSTGAGVPVAMGGGGTVNVVLELSPSGDRVIDAIMAGIRPKVRGQHFGNVQAALGGFQ